MLKNTIKGLLALSLALCVTAHAQLHISFSQTEDGNTLVSFSGVVRPSTLGQGYDEQNTIYETGQSVVFIDHDTMTVSMTDGVTPVEAYAFSGVRMIGDIPITSINYTTSATDADAPGSGAGFTFRNDWLSLYDGSGNRDWIDWSGYSFVVPQSIAEMGLTADSSGTMTFYDGRTFEAIVSIAWSVGSAVPEPTAYAAFIGLSVLGCVLVRRRNATARA